MRRWSSRTIRLRSPTKRGRLRPRCARPPAGRHSKFSWKERAKSREDRRRVPRHHAADAEHDRASPAARRARASRCGTRSGRAHLRHRHAPAGHARRDVRSGRSRDPRPLPRPRPQRHRRRARGRGQVDGTEVRIDRRYVEADLRIVTGFVEPHFFAGFSGGPKAVCPGLADLDTDPRGAFEAQDLDPAWPRGPSWTATRFTSSSGERPVWPRRRSRSTSRSTGQRRLTGVFCGPLPGAHRAACESVLSTLGVLGRGPVRRRAHARTAVTRSTATSTRP